MNNDPLLKIRFEGEAVGSGKISLAHLLRFFTNMTKALQRTGRVLMSEADSVWRETPTRSIKEDLALDLVLLTHGSPAAVLGFERRQSEVGLPGMDFGLEVMEKVLLGLAIVQQSDNQLPVGYDTGVLRAWCDAGTLFRQGISRIEFSFNQRDASVTTAFTPEGFARIQERIRGPQTNIRTIEGRLLMADFKEHGTRCRVHPSIGEPVLCLFDQEKKDEVLENILQYVRILGEAKEDPLTGRIVSIKIQDIKRLEDQEEDIDLLPQGTPIARDFWESPTLDELAQAQDVSPMADVRAIFGTWPSETNDDFEETIDELRHSHIGKGQFS